MNQILIIDNKKKLHIKFKIIFWIFFLLSIIFLIYFIFFKYSSLKKASISNNLRNSYQIQSLYSNLSNNQIRYSQTNKTNTFVLGLIEIPKINLTYPILSNTSEENLEICPCHFYGPNPNMIGNMCIAGHNYSNNTMFGKLYLLELNDLIYIYDLNGTKKEYTVYEQFDVDSSDMSCLSQNTNGNYEITLITCSLLDNKRYIIKAKENRY